MLAEVRALGTRDEEGVEIHERRRTRDEDGERHE
jgi:hypothetical protein